MSQQLLRWCLRWETFSYRIPVVRSWLVTVFLPRPLKGLTAVQGARGWLFLMYKIHWGFTLLSPSYTL